MSGARGPYSPRGVARERKPIPPSASVPKWRGRYVDLDGEVRQCGRHGTRKEAAAETRRVVDELNRRGARPRGAPAPSARAFLASEWLDTFPRQPTTAQTHRERVNRLLKALGAAADLPLDELRRAHLISALGVLLDKGLAKDTIDNSVAALSLMLRDAADLDYVAEDVAAGLRVRPSDPRLNRNPKRAEHRALTLDEMYAFIDCVPTEHLGQAWTSAVCGARPGELFAANQRYVDRRRGLIYLHQTVSKNGRLMNGLKGTHDVPEIRKRGRFTLWPSSLQSIFDEAGVHSDGWLVPSPTGCFWSHRNFYAKPEKRPSSWWKRAVAASGVEPFTIYDLRHSFSSWLQAVPIPAVEVSAWMGHSLREGGVRVDTTTARIYTHGTGQWREAALAALEDIMLRRAPTQRSVAGSGEKGDGEVTPVELGSIFSGSMAS